MINLVRLFLARFSNLTLKKPVLPMNKKSVLFQLLYNNPVPCLMNLTIIDIGLRFLVWSCTGVPSSISHPNTGMNTVFLVYSLEINLGSLINLSKNSKYKANALSFLNLLFLKNNSL